MLDFSRFASDPVYTALHESGHAVCARVLGYTVERISIRKELDKDGAVSSEGHCDYLPPESSHNDTILLSGLAACILYDELTGKNSPGLVEGHEEDSRTDILSTRGPVEAAYKRSKKLLSENWDAVERVSMAVLKSRFGVIVGSEIDKALKPR